MPRLTHPRRFSPLRLLAWLLAAFVVLQLVPYGRAHSNPPVRATPNWDSAQTRELFARACADCHSNVTQWPWYSNVAPVSWLVQRHVDEGRAQFNASEPGFGREAEEAAEQVEQGEMPEPTYLPLHPEARLSAPERDMLIRGLAATFGSDGGGEGGERGGSKD